MNTLDPQFLEAICRMVDFKGTEIRRVQAALLYIGLAGHDFTAADVPSHLTNGDEHIAGAATGGLLASRLVEVVGRVKSPKPDAHGRKVNVLRIAPGKWNTAQTWLTRNGFDQSPVDQLRLAL